jgi:predicted Rossmann-fold nucleotide-binding protein
MGILNVDGFFDNWIAWEKRAVQEGLIKPVFHDFLFVDTDPERLLEKLSSFRPAKDVGKFITKA